MIKKTFSLFLCIVLAMPYQVLAATQESWSLSQNDFDVISTTSKRHGQSFTPSSTYSITGASGYFYKIGGGAAIVTMELYATDGSGFPTGSALASGSADSSGLSTSVYSLFAITFGTPYTVNNGTKYALVWKVDSDGVRSGLHTPSGYSGGAWLYSTDSGSSWTTFSDAYDFAQVEIYGDTVDTYTPLNYNIIYGNWNNAVIATST